MTLAGYKRHLRAGAAPGPLSRKGDVAEYEDGQYLSIDDNVDGDVDDDEFGDDVDDDDELHSREEEEMKEFKETEVMILMMMMMMLVLLLLMVMIWYGWYMDCNNEIYKCDQRLGSTMLTQDCC